MVVLRSRYFLHNQRLQSAASNGRPLAKGETSDGVRMMQAGLRDLGYALPRSTRNDKTLDGVFGDETDAAVKQFQQDHKLKPDGLAGPRTLRAMDDDLFAQQPPLPPRPPRRRPTRPPRPRPLPVPPMPPRPAPPGPGPTPPAPTPPAPTPPVNVDDPFYKIGRDDPPLGHDPGAGAWNSVPWTFSAVAQKEAIERLCTSGATNVYPGYNATRHMLHYFGNHGRPLTIHLESMIADVPAAKEAMVAEFRQAQAFVQKLPPGTHYFTSKSGESSYNTKAQSADWFFAIGGYTFWGKGKVTITMVGGQKQYEMEFEYNFYDRYNWDGGKSVTIMGITVTDQFMGEFHREGLAREFDCFGKVRRRFRWLGDVAVPSDQLIVAPQYGR